MSSFDVASYLIPHADLIMPLTSVSPTVLLDKPPEKPPSGPSTGVDVAGMLAFPAPQNKARLVGLPFHFREAIATIVIIFDWSDWGTKENDTECLQPKHTIAAEAVESLSCKMMSRMARGHPLRSIQPSLHL